VSSLALLMDSRTNNLATGKILVEEWKRIISEDNENFTK